MGACDRATWRARTMVALAALVSALGAAASASAKNHFPVIGCSTTNGFNHYDWRYKPYRYCDTGGTSGSTEGIDKTRWRKWGQGRAYATGYFVDGLGFEYKAKITAYRLTRCHNCFGIHGYTVSSYNRLRVIANGAVRGGVFRGPFDVTIDSTPWE